jgi:RNA polymerase sigma-70 factor (ECF subfamily)
LGDSASFKAELAQQIVALRRYAFVLAGNRADAEDLVQECLARAIAAADSWPGGPNLRRWLFRILHNLHVSDIRRRRVRAEHDGATIPDSARPPEQPLKLEAKAVLGALARLPEAQRQALTLIAIEGMRYDEAAAILGIPQGTLMSRLARGREALRRAVLDDGSRRDSPVLRLVKGRP